MQNEVLCNTRLQTTSKPRKFYRITALAMMIAGSALLLFSVSNIINRQAACQDDVIPAHCIDPMFEIAPSSNDFILIILAICLLSFGGSILGMITRL
jgi:hypothetical protein